MLECQKFGVAPVIALRHCWSVRVSSRASLPGTSGRLGVRVSTESVPLPGWLAQPERKVVPPFNLASCQASWSGARSHSRSDGLISKHAFLPDKPARGRKKHARFLRQKILVDTEFPKSQGDATASIQQLLLLVRRIRCVVTQMAFQQNVVLQTSQMHLLQSSVSCHTRQTGAANR